MDAWLRASDADRERTVAALRRHVADGRISVEEFSERSAAAYAARTFGDLDAVTADLPPVEQDRPVEMTSGRGLDRPGSSPGSRRSPPSPPPWSPGSSSRRAP